MPTVLLIGSHGMLGQELNREFLQAGYIVDANDFDTLDITDIEACRKKIQELQPEIVVNAAAINSVDKIEESEEEFEKAKKINSIAPGELVKLCKEYGAIFIHYSSDYVFSGEEKIEYSEDTTVQPLSRYGETKAEGEKKVQENGEKFYIIRLSKLFGKPASSQNAKKSFVDTMLKFVLEDGKTKIEVVDEEMSSPTYAPDLAHFTRVLLESQKPSGIYHGANSGACTWYELAKKTFEFKNLSVEVIPVSGEKYPRPAKRPKFSELLNTKMTPQRSWQDALQDYLQE